MYLCPCSAGNSNRPARICLEIIPALPARPGGDSPISKARVLFDVICLVPLHVVGFSLPEPDMRKSDKPCHSVNKREK